ncbi:MAG: SUMF1/EgtB/PvdO family nonheme iron enzyme, partial [Planctomycetales bacterium]|nr:SUMF1/EgtB/PvdO family nonheme iron enzyme [Planctomycetales bacterium]
MRLVCLGVRALCVTSCLVTFVHSVEFDLMTVGDPGNRYDRTYGVPSNPARYGRFGAVNYAFEMATTEVTHNQYVEFLNSVAASDPHGLFDELMMSRPRGGIIRTGEEGSYAYEAKPKAGYLPVTFVTFWDAARFANWMHNGQPTGPSGPETTESGAYELGGVTYPDNFSVTRNPDAVWFLPSENEWYKAAYYDPRTQAE